MRIGTKIKTIVVGLSASLRKDVGASDELRRDDDAPAENGERADVFAGLAAGKRAARPDRAAGGTPANRLRPSIRNELRDEDMIGKTRVWQKKWRNV